MATAATLRPEDPGGLNIEGLAASAEGHLLVGFRNPVPAGRALIVRIENPGDVVMGAAAAKVSKAALLNLGGRGVRALEPTRDGKFLVLAGASTTRRTSRCCVGTARVHRRRWCSMVRGLNALNAEELVLWPDTPDRVDLISDDGDALVDEKKCKKADVSVRSFRVTAVPVNR